jgi:integrase
LKVPSSISENRKESVHFPRPELTETLKAFRPAGTKAGDWAFLGQVPRVPTFKRGLAAAGIPFGDERGRRVDLQALRTTFGTLLSASGVSPRVAMELMRHSQRSETHDEGLHRRFAAAAHRRRGTVTFVLPSVE